MEIVKYFTDNSGFIIPLITLIGIIFGIVGTIYGIKSYKFQKSMAEKQGVFQSPSIQLNLYLLGWRGIDANNSAPHNILIATKIPKNGTVLFPLLISLTNEGSKTGREIHLLLKYHKNLAESCLDVGSPRVKFNQNTKESPRFWQSGEFQFIYINVGTLIPKSDFSFRHEISINYGTLGNQIEVDAVTKDSIPVRASVEYGFAYHIEYSIFQDDSTPIAGSITVGVLDTSQKSLVDYIRFENAKNKKKYDNLNLFQKIKTFVNSEKIGNDQGPILAVTCNELKIKHAAKGKISRVSASDLEYYYEDQIGRKHCIREAGNCTLEPLFPHL